METIVRTTPDISEGANQRLTWWEERTLERRAAVRRMTAQGQSASEIAVRLDCTVRTVERHRAALRSEVAA